MASDLATKYPDAIKLTVGEPNFDTPAYIKEAAKKAMDAGETHYSPNAGMNVLREAIAKKYASYDAGYTADNVIVTVGAMEGLMLTMLLILNPGDEISKNGSPSVGMDREGVTALIKSALKARPYTYCESFCVDVMLHPTAVSGDEGLEIMKSLLFMYMKNGGQTVQFNVFNTETLRDAQKRPEKYQNLQVRVCGWNVLWNNLSEKEQNAYITRAENIR